MIWKYTKIKEEVRKANWRRRSRDTLSRVWTERERCL